jgi:hypothetical protein
MTASHLRMILCELEGVDESTMDTTIIYFDSKSAIAMGLSDRDTNIPDTSSDFIITSEKISLTTSSPWDGSKQSSKLLTLVERSIQDLVTNSTTIWSNRGESIIVTVTLKCDI